jgi:hypothetical protein
MVEMAGIEPASKNIIYGSSTSLVIFENSFSKQKITNKFKNISFKSYS